MEDGRARAVADVDGGGGGGAARQQFDVDDGIDVAISGLGQIFEWLDLDTDRMRRLPHAPDRVRVHYVACGMARH